LFFSNENAANAQAARRRCWAGGFGERFSAQAAGYFSQQLEQRVGIDLEKRNAELISNCRNRHSVKENGLVGFYGGARNGDKPARDFLLYGKNISSGQKTGYRYVASEIGIRYGKNFELSSRLRIESLDLLTKNGSVSNLSPRRFLA
jgi:hypothetical protein